MPYIDWTPFFHAWELKGIYPRIFEQDVVGPRARELFEDGRKLLERIVREKLLVARAVIGFFPANSVAEDIEIYADESRAAIVGSFHTLRQQLVKADAGVDYALADFVAPRESGAADYLGAFACTAGLCIEPLVKKFEQDHDDYNALMTKALADRLAEGLAELMHKRVREEWGFGRDENLTPDEMMHEKYRGIRPAPGYPASPDHTEKSTAVRFVAGAGIDGNSFDREFRDVSGGVCVRALFFAS